MKQRQWGGEGQEDWGAGSVEKRIGGLVRVTIIP
jgi:hypothetical protein